MDEARYIVNSSDGGDLCYCIYDNEDERIIADFISKDDAAHIALLLNIDQLNNGHDYDYDYD